MIPKITMVRINQETVYIKNAPFPLPAQKTKAALGPSPPHSPPRLAMGRAGRGLRMGYIPLQCTLVFFLAFFACFSLGQVVDVFVVPHSVCPISSEQSINQTYSTVKAILNGVVASLSSDPHRKFTWAETFYLKRWWSEVNATVRSKFSYLVDEKQIEFASGGLVENGVATNFYPPVVDQMSLGHQWLKSTFGVESVPRIGWQVQSAGASPVIGLLWNLLGFDANVVNHVGETLKQPLPGVPGSGSYRKEETFEFVWNVQSSRGEVPTDVFTHVLDSGYESPAGFDFEGPPGSNPPITRTNVKERADLLVSIVRERNSWYRHDNLLMPFGGELRFEDSMAEFENIDKLITYVNANMDYGVNMHYATVGEYFDALYNRTRENTIYPMFSQDVNFFPYDDWGYLNETCKALIDRFSSSDAPNNDDGEAYRYCLSYWSGEYSARPALKGLSRDLESTVRMADVFLSFAQAKQSRDDHHLSEPVSSWGVLYDQVQSAKEIQSILQHAGVDNSTNAITSNHIRPNATRALQSASDVIIQTAQYLLSNTSIATPVLSINASLFNRTKAPLANRTLPITFANSLGWSQEFYARLALKDLVDGEPDTSVMCVVDFFNQSVPSQLVQTPEGWELYFLAISPPVGMSTYFVVLNGTSCSESPEVSAMQDVSGNTSFVLENDLLTLYFVKAQDMVFNLESIHNARIGRSLQVHHRFMEYQSFSPDHLGQYDNSVAFRPAGPATLLNITTRPAAHRSVGTLVSVFVQDISPSVRQVVRIYNGLESHAEVSSRVELEISTHSKANTDVVMRCNTNISSGRMFYTDDGLQIRKREFVLTPVNYDNTLNISSNYYPAQTTAYVKDLDDQFMVLSHQPMGVASLEHGALEIMLNRGNAGPGEVVQRTLSTQTFWLLYDTPDTCQRLRQPLSYQLVYPPLVLFNNYTGASYVPWLPVFSALTMPLPKNVHLLSVSLMQRGTSRQVALRVNHIYEDGDDLFLSQPVTISMSAILGQYSLSRIVETNLAITAPYDGCPREPYRTPPNNGTRAPPTSMSNDVHHHDYWTHRYHDNAEDHIGQFFVSLSPMQIRSFSINMQLDDDGGGRGWFEISSFFLGIGAGLATAGVGALLFYVIFGMRLRHHPHVFAALDSSDDDSSDYLDISPVLSEESDGEWGVDVRRDRSIQF